MDPFFLSSDEDGVLGRNVYERLLMILDYPAQQIKLEECRLQSRMDGLHWNPIPIGERRSDAPDATARA